MRFFNYLSMLLIVLGASESALAIRLAELQPFEYEVKFTNPECALYEYREPILSVSGQTLTAKPKNAYCKPGDAAISGERPTSPQWKLTEWIRDPATTEIFFAYLSFSNGVIREELCRAIEERDVKVRFVLDSGTDLNHANRLLACKPLSGREERKPELFLRGNTGGLGYAHNKLFLVNPSDPARYRVAFASGNLSSGVVLHHENWHFITTNPDSYFAKAHQCVVAGMLEHAASRGEYSKYIRECRAAIKAPEEEDIKIFLIPGDGGAATRLLGEAVRRSDEIRIAAHRFSYGKLLKFLNDRLNNEYPVEMSLVVDDDIYWAGQGLTVGANTRDEHGRVAALEREGMGVRYVQTNHGMSQFHHNKFIIFRGEDFGGVFAGAGNLTTAAFEDNFENFYFITIPKVVEDFHAQYDHLWSGLATKQADMPVRNVLP